MKVGKLSGIDLADITTSDGVASLVPCGEDRFEEMMETERQDPYSGCYSCRIDDKNEARRIFFRGKERLFAVIRERDGAYAGYCTVHDITKTDWELGISLLPETQGDGLGLSAYRQLIDIARRAHKGGIVGKVEPDNYASLRMMMKLGAAPKGLCPATAIPENERQRIEEEYADLIDGNIEALAAWFRVPSCKLLTHVLMFDLAKCSDSTTRLPLANQRRRISMLHKAYERKRLLDELEKVVEGLEGVLSDDAKEMIAETRRSIDEGFAQVREA